MDVGDVVDDFALPDQHGETVRLSELLGDGSAVLFFYPRAMTTGCTKESCHFRDLRSEFAEVGARIAGISPDPVDRQREFDQRDQLGFPLLSDPEQDVARQFGVKRVGPLPLKRATFVIDGERRVVAAIRSEMDMLTHADDALGALRARVAD